MRFRLETFVLLSAALTTLSALSALSTLSTLTGCTESKDAGSGAPGVEESATAKPAADPPTGESGKLGGALKAPREETAAPATFQPATYSRADVPSDLKVEGTIEDGLRFSDKNGDNWVLFSRKKTSTTKNGGSHSEYLYVHHFAIGPGGATAELRVVRDKVEECDLDLVLAVDKKSLETTDLDGDGIGEVSFGYEMTCAGDISPAIYKLLLLEGGDKYIIRGETTVVMAGEPPMGGAMNVDKSFRDGPKAFRDHAVKRWPTLTKRRL